jgi:hypothetical protein
MKKGGLFIVLILSLGLKAQDTKNISGIILDKLTNTPIPWAHLFIQSIGNGTVSNAEGRFSISSPINTPSKITISCVGYKSRSMGFEGEFSNIKIFLEPEIKLLNEIVVMPINVRQLILEAVKKIPFNYPAKPTLLTGFYRESLRYDSIRYIYLSEGVIQARKESYTQAEQKGQVKLIKSRKKEFSDSAQTLRKVRFYGGSHSVHTGDFVMGRKEFINELTIEEYDYSIYEITYLNGSEVYKISFRPKKPSALFFGELYLDSKSRCFVSARYKLTDAGIRKYKEPLNIFSSPLSAERIVHYMKVGNNWMIQDTWGESRWYNKRVKDTVIFQSEFVTTRVDTIGIESFNYADKIQYRDIFINKATNLDSNFWNGYTILKENSFLQRIQNKDLNNKSIATDYPKPHSSSLEKNSNKRPFLEFLERTTFDIAVTNLLPSYSISDINLTGNGFSVNSPTNQSDFLALCLHSSLNVNLDKRLIIGLGFTSSIGKLGFDNATLMSGYKWQATIKTRPLKLIGGLGFSYNSIYLPIGTIKGPLSIAGKRLSEGIDVNLQREFFALQPSLKIALELNRRWDFFISVNYLFNLGIENKILFEEQAGFFFKKNATVKANDSSIDFRIDGIKTTLVPELINSLFLNVGFTYKAGR